MCKSTVFQRACFWRLQVVPGMLILLLAASGVAYTQTALDECSPLEQRLLKSSIY
jgi:hypothetical protein